MIEPGRAGMVALLTIGPLALGVCVLMLVLAGLVKLFSSDKQGWARFAVDVAITIAAGAVLVVAVAYLAF